MKRIFLVIAILVGVMAVYAFWPWADRLGYLANDGDAYDVEILRDTWGIPHVFGVTDADAAFGLAYAHAEDDFLTIQQGLVAARGDLATFYGIDAVANDYMVALLGIWDLVDAQYDVAISAETRQLVEAYAAGLNLYASQHPDEAFRGVFPATGKDVIAGSVHKSPLFFGLDGTLGRLFERVSDEDPSPQPSPEGEGARAVPFTQHATRNIGFTGLGSNVIAVAPSRTSDGSTYFAGNSHQPWEGPVTWYEAHLHSEEGLDMTGGTFPGMPVITLGHNRDIAWSFTVNDPDLIDVYDLTLNPENPDQYRFDGEWRDFEIERAWLTINLVRSVGWGDEYFGRFNIPVPREIVSSAYGPVFRNDTEAYAIRYANFDTIGIFEQLHQLNRATNRQEFVDAMNLPGLPMFNVGYADKEGNIGYVYNARVPDRDPQFEWADELDGDSSEVLWSGYESFESLPQVWNPAVGFIQNANSSPYRTTDTTDDPVLSETPAHYGVETIMTNRALRLLELFGDDSSITWDEFRAYKFDWTYSAESDMALWKEKIAAQSFTDSNVQAAADLLSNWNLEMAPESEGGALALMLLSFLRDDNRTDIGISHLVGSTVADDVLFESFEAAVARLMETNDGQFAVPLSHINRARRGDIELGMGGAPDVPYAIYGPQNEEGRSIAVAGETYIGLVRWDKDGEISAEALHQYGSATLDKTSPHYADQLPLLVNRELRREFFDEADIRANLEEAYRPQER